MLDCAWNTDSDIKVGSDYFTSLADLHVVGYHACINCRSWSTYSTVWFTKSICNIIQHLEILSSFKSSATTHNIFSRCQICHFRLGYNILDPLTLCVRNDVFNPWHSLSRVILGISLKNFLKIGTPDSQEFYLVWRWHSAKCITSVYGSHKLSSAINNLNNICDSLKVQKTTKSWNYIFTKSTGCSNNIGVVVLCN